MSFGAGGSHVLAAARKGVPQAPPGRLLSLRSRAAGPALVAEPPEFEETTFRALRREGRVLLCEGSGRKRSGKWSPGQGAAVSSPRLWGGAWAPAPQGLAESLTGGRWAPRRWCLIRTGAAGCRPRPGGAAPWEEQQTHLSVSLKS